MYIKTSKMRAERGARGKLEGVYLGVNDRKLPQRNNAMQSICEVWRTTLYERPVILPEASISICSAAGTFPRPGMRFMSPATATMKFAPPLKIMSRT